MRRTSLTPAQAQQLSVLLKERREFYGLSMRQLATEAGMRVSMISTLEAGINLGPTPETLRDLAKALHIQMIEMLLVTEWLPAEELPALRPYLRAKYRELSDSDLATLERYIDQLSDRHGTAGPQNHEDERP